MRRSGHEKLSRRERQIVDALYRRGEATVSEVIEEMDDPVPGDDLAERRAPIPSQEVAVGLEEREGDLRLLGADVGDGEEGHSVHRGGEGRDLHGGGAARRELDGEGHLYPVRNSCKVEQGVLNSLFQLKKIFPIPDRF